MYSRGINTSCDDQKRASSLFLGRCLNRRAVPVCPSIIYDPHDIKQPQGFSLWRLTLKKRPGHNLALNPWFLFPLTFKLSLPLAACHVASKEAVFLQSSASILWMETWGFSRQVRCQIGVKLQRKSVDVNTVWCFVVLLLEVWSIA